MKARVRLTYSVELSVEGANEDVIMDWLEQTTPSEAHECAAKNGHIICEDYDEEIVCPIRDDSVVDYVI